jgi:hypothetical protein
MKTASVVKIAKQEINNPLNRMVFVRFFTKRFPKESHIQYVREWARRFEHPVWGPEVWMDSESLAIYRKVKP